MVVGLGDHVARFGGIPEDEAVETRGMAVADELERARPRGQAELHYFPNRP